MTFWHEGDKVQNIHLGSSRKKDEETTREGSQLLFTKPFKWDKRSYSMDGDL